MILASQSPRRRELLEAMGFNLTVAPADIDETSLEGETPVELVSRLSCEKATASLLALAPDAPDEDGLLVAADTIVWTDDGTALGKPADDADAAAMLATLSGATHHVSTGVCALRLSPAGTVLASSDFVETTDVTFFPLTNAEIAAYVATGEPLDKAGAYGIQGEGRLLVKEIRGDYSNVVGLPVARLVRELGTLMGEQDLVARTMKGRR